MCVELFSMPQIKVSQNIILTTTKLIQLIKPEFLFNSYVSTKSFRGFFFNIYLDLIFNFITSEDITLFVYIGFDIKTSFSTFQTVISLLTMNIHTVKVSLKKSQLFHVSYQISFKKNFEYMYIFDTELIEVLHNRKYKGTIDSQR